MARNHPRGTDAMRGQTQPPSTWTDDKDHGLWRFSAASTESDRGYSPRTSFSESIANAPASPDYPPMNAVPREELDAKLQTVRAEVDGHFVRFEDKLDRIVDSLADIKNEGRENRRHTSGLLWGVIFAVIGSAIGLFSAMSGSNSALLSAFQTGIAVSQTHAPSAQPAELAAPAPAPAAATDKPPTPTKP